MTFPPAFKARDVLHHGIIRRASRASREVGVIVVFSVALLVATGLVSILISREVPGSEPLVQRIKCVKPEGPGAMGFQE
jgi:hypothetical protein